MLLNIIDFISRSSLSRLDIWTRTKLSPSHSHSRHSHNQSPEMVIPGYQFEPPLTFHCLQDKNKTIPLTLPLPSHSPFPIEIFHRPFIDFFRVKNQMDEWRVCVCACVCELWPKLSPKESFVERMQLLFQIFNYYIIFFDFFFSLL